RHREESTTKPRFTKKLPDEFLKPDALHEYIPTMDSMVKQHLQENWVPNKEVKVYPLTQQYTFALACSLFMSIKDPGQVNRISEPFKDVLTGLLSVPINFPGTTYNRAIKKGKRLREVLIGIIKQRRKELLENKETRKIDMVTRLLQTSEYSDCEICDRIVGMFVASYDTTTPMSMTKSSKQMEVHKSKQAGELLNWQDIQKMKYTWCVACEAMRLLPPARGAFRQAITDFTYQGFTIPKGWKIHWSVHTTHKNPKYFPEPEKFDPSRFEGNGPIPYSFMLVFIHNVVTKIKLRMVNPDEKIVYDFTPYPENG
ncbi:hypothetical protein Tsubulata_045714, partial [Turnera subulata]